MVYLLIIFITVVFYPVVVSSTMAEEDSDPSEFISRLIRTKYGQDPEQSAGEAGQEAWQAVIGNNTFQPEWYKVIERLPEVPVGPAGMRGDLHKQNHIFEHNLYHSMTGEQYLRKNPDFNLRKEQKRRDNIDKELSLLINKAKKIASGVSDPDERQRAENAYAFLKALQSEYKILWEDKSLSK